VNVPTCPVCDASPPPTAAELAGGLAIMLIAAVLVVVASEVKRWARGKR
jgi:hypothetical protein